MAGRVPAIHILSRVEDVDPRNKSRDDGEGGRIGGPEWREDLSGIGAGAHKSGHPRLWKTSSSINL
jgi:hypothetical protein